MVEVLGDKTDLTTLNAHLIERLDQVILGTDNAEDLLNLTEAVAKLNASSRNNNKLNAEETEAERQERAVADAFGEELTEAAIIN